MLPLAAKFFKKVKKSSFFKKIFPLFFEYASLKLF